MFRSKASEIWVLLLIPFPVTLSLIPCFPKEELAIADVPAIKRDLRTYGEACWNRPDVHSVPHSGKLDASKAAHK